MSCQKYRESRQRAILETWYKDVPNGVKVFFFEGGHENKEMIVGDRIYLSCGDSYEDQALKTYSVLSFIYTNLDFKYFFKCDDDTYVYPQRLLKCGFEKHDYMGNLPPGPHWKNGVYAQGGAYFLSKKAIKSILGFPFSNGKGKRWWWGGLVYRQGNEGPLQSNTTTEDVMVGDILRESGIPLYVDSRLQHDPWPYPYLTTRQITCHHVSPEEMRKVYLISKNILLRAYLFLKFNSKALLNKILCMLRASLNRRE